MIRQCAWCKMMMGESPPYADKSVTHGMCEKCGVKYTFIAELMGLIKRVVRKK